ncbi:protein of unknown function [Oryzisolibacter propanilivorax]|uniref:DUF4376 domain-containing protein n=1 Tax=Oryzisolibacter propanilivorax TaxID=1527607 RepID=A0A1G9UC30_9BURK|nr:DUF4376 domain-containing protein [Oryzisolibacter propanilivorax]SDM57459.1 protein of unknown function [Oryzisolibacter propanilivorax]
MARYAVIHGGVVQNHALADDVFAAAQGWVPAGDSQVGDRWDGHAFVPAPADLDALKAAKNDEINAARLAANFSHFEHAGKQIACDQLSRSDIDGTNGFVALYGALPPGWPGGWKAIDNTYVAIADVAAWKAFYASMFAAGNANFAHAQALKEALAAAATAEEVAAIGWGMEAP